MKRLHRYLWRLADSAERIVRFSKLVEEGREVPTLLLHREAWIAFRRSARLWLYLTWRRILRRGDDI